MLKPRLPVLRCAWSSAYRPGPGGPGGCPGAARQDAGGPRWVYKAGLAQAYTEGAVLPPCASALGSIVMDTRVPRVRRAVAFVPDCLAVTVIYLLPWPLSAQGSCRTSGGHWLPVARA